MGWLSSGVKKLKRTAKRSFTVKGLVNNAKNLSGVGLLQRSKTARKVALAGAAVVGAVYAAPYAASIGKAALAGAGKIGGAAVAGGSSLLTKLYAPPMNGPGPAAESEPQDLQTQLYGAEVDPSLTADQMSNTRTFRSAAPGFAAAAPASCASTGGSVDEIGFYVVIGSYLVICLISASIATWKKINGSNAKITTG